MAKRGLPFYLNQLAEFFACVTGGGRPNLTSGHVPFLCRFFGGWRKGIESGRTESAGEWHGDDEFWAFVEPRIFTDKVMESTQKEVDQILELMGLSPSARLLDLACGIGRHSIELARRGYRVTGVDRSHSYLQKAERAARDSGVSIEFVEKDMREFRQPNTYDGAINLYTSFGYFPDASDDLQVLVNVFESLQPGASFLIDLVGKEIFLRSFKAQVLRREGDVTVLEERSLNEDQTWLENRWVVSKGAEHKEFKVAHRLYSAEALRVILERAGFFQIEIYGDLQRNPYDQNAKRLVALARKPSGGVHHKAAPSGTDSRSSGTGRPRNERTKLADPSSRLLIKRGDVPLIDGGMVLMAGDCDEKTVQREKAKPPFRGAPYQARFFSHTLFSRAQTPVRSFSLL